MVELTQRRRSVLICLCLALTTAAVYWPVRHFEFTNYDDGDYVYQNPQVQSGLTWRGLVWAFTTNHSNNWHPLTWLSHMLDWQLWGGNAGAHHLVNVLLHVANTLLLFSVLRRMTAAPWRSGFLAAVFALHPLHVESVAWVAERKDVLSAFFWMLTMWAYVWYVEQPNRKRYWLSLGLYALGLMAKPMVVTLPFVLLLLDYWPLGRTRWAKAVIGARAEKPLSRLVKEKLPFLVLTVASCAATVWAQHSSIAPFERLPLSSRLANAVVSYVRYMGKVFWPDGLAVFYPYETWPLSTVLLASAVLLGVSGVVVWRASREPYLATGWLWYLGTLVPVIGLAQVGIQSMADRYTYVPLVGLLIMVAWGLSELLPPRRRAQVELRAIALTAVIAMLVGTWHELRHWQNSITLFEHALAVTKDNAVAHSNLGVALVEVGRVEEALAHFEQSLRIDPDNAETHNNLGGALGQAGKVQEAIEHFDRALQINPDSAEAHYNLGLALAQLGKVQDAAEHWKRALRVKPDYAEAYYNLGGALWQAGKRPEAIVHWEQALRIKPDYAEAHRSLGLALEQTGRVRDAIGHFEHVLQIQPDNSEIQNHLARLLAKLGTAEDRQSDANVPR